MQPAAAVGVVLLHTIADDEEGRVCVVPAGLKSLNTVTASVLDKLIFRKSSAQKR